MIFHKWSIKKLFSFSVVSEPCVFHLQVVFHKRNIVSKLFKTIHIDLCLLSNCGCVARLLRLIWVALKFSIPHKWKNFSTFCSTFLGNCGCVARLSNVSLQKNKLKKLISLLQIYCTKLNFQKLHFLFEFTAETSIYKCHINFPAENSPFLSRPRSRRESFSNWKDRDPGIVCT